MITWVGKVDRKHLLGPVISIPVYAGSQSWPATQIIHRAYLVGPKAD